MKNSDEWREELKGSPFLQKMKGKGEGFKVPANYFKNLPDEALVTALKSDQGLRLLFDEQIGAE